MTRRIAAAFALSALVLGACSATSGATVGPNLTIFGAASLKAALEAVAAAYETAHPGTTITVSTDSSAALETQIEQGAPADVFLSADTANPQKLVDAGLAAGEPVAFAVEGIVVVVASDLVRKPRCEPTQEHQPRNVEEREAETILAR